MQSRLALPGAVDTGENPVEAEDVSGGPIKPFILCIGDNETYLHLRKAVLAWGFYRRSPRFLLELLIEAPSRA